MTRYLKILNCSIKIHKCVKALDIISVAVTSLLSLLTLIKAYARLCK
ncbi:MAG: hypothetical protein K5756_07875 [Clostridiales bacterium]|nr:hypothetical protein [Clostridiales bacterium]